MAGFSLDPSKRYVSLVLAAGVLVLLAAIGIGEHMGDKVLGQAASSGPAAMPVVSPASLPTSGPFGPDWKRSQTLAAAPDPGFPDPRVPPKPVPTLPPPPSPRPVHRTWTPNPNIPIWDQTPPPSGGPAGTPTPAATPTPGSERPSASPSTSPSP